jgi:hypothetical protein
MHLSLQLPDARLSDVLITRQAHAQDIVVTALTSMALKASSADGPGLNG